MKHLGCLKIKLFFNNYQNREIRKSIKPQLYNVIIDKTIIFSRNYGLKCLISNVKMEKVFSADVERKIAFCYERTLR